MAAQAEERTLPPHARLSAVCAVMRCGRPSERDHPKLGMRLCKHHWLIFFANLRNGFPVADDGSSVLCELCCNESLGTGNELEAEGDALTLTLCDGCKKAWCHDCISSRMGEEYAKQTSEREWKCPYCSPSMRKAFCGDAEFVPLHLSVGQRVAAARQGQFEPRDGIIMCLTAEDPAANDADAAEGEQASLVASILFDDNAWEERVPRRLIFAPHAAATPAAAAKPKVIRDTFIERGAVRKFTVKEAAYTARFLFDSMREDGTAARGEQRQAELRELLRRLQDVWRCNDEMLGASGLRTALQQMERHADEPLRHGASAALRRITEANSQKLPAATGSDAQPPKPLAVGELLFAPPRARGSPALGDFELGLVLFVEPSNIDCHILWMTQGDKAVMMRKAASRSVLRSLAQEKWWRLGHATLGTPARLESFSEDELGCFSREDAEELVRAAAPHLPENAPLKRQRQAKTPSFGDTVVQKVERPAKQKKLAAVAASSAAMAPGGADVSVGQRDFALHERSGGVSPPQSNAVVVANTPAERAASMADSSAEKDAHRVRTEGVSPAAGREEAAAVRRTPAESAASKAASSAEEDAHRVPIEGVSPTVGGAAHGKKAAAVRRAPAESAASKADSSDEEDAHRVATEGVSATEKGSSPRKKAAAVRRAPAESAASKADSSDEEDAHRVATEGVSATEKGSSPRKKAAAVRRAPAESAASKADSSDEEDAHRVRTEGTPATERGSPPSNNQTAPAEGAAADADSSDDVIGEEPSHIRLSDEEWLPEDKRKVTLAKASDEERHHGSSKASQSPGKPRSVIPVVAPAAAATSPTAGLHASAATGEKPRKRKAPHELPRGDAPRLAAAPAPSAASVSAPADAASPHRVNKQTFVQILRQEHFDDAEQVQQWVNIMRRCTQPAEQTSLLKPFLKKFDTATYKSLVGASGGLELLKRWLELAIDQSPQAGSSVQLIKDVLELVTRLPLSFDRLKQTDLGPLLPKLEAHGDEEVVRLALAVKRAILKVAHAEIRLDLPVAGDPAPFAFIEGASGEHTTTAASPRVPPSSQPIGKKASKPVRQKPSELVDWIIAKAPQLPAIHRPSVATSIPTASPVAPASHATALVEEAAAWPTAALSLEPTVVFTEDDPSLADEVWRKLRAPVRIIRELTTEYLRARPQLLVLIDRGKIPRICEYKDWNWLELKHNPRAVIVDKFYILRCLEEGKFLPLLKEEQYFPSGGIVLVDALTCNANEQMVQSVACELRRLSDARSIWQMMLIPSREENLPAPSSAIEALLNQHEPFFRLLPEHRMSSLLCQQGNKQLPLLLDLALHESVTLDTAAYRRHVVVLATELAISQKVREEHLQIHVCTNAEGVKDYLEWLRQRAQEELSDP